MYKFLLSKLLRLIFLGLLLPLYIPLSTSLDAQDPEPSLKKDFSSPREIILWSNFREKVRAVLPDYSIAELSQELAELDVDAQYIGGDLLISATGDYKATLEPDTTTYNFSAVPKISKKFLPTGTTLSAELDARLRVVDAASTLNTATLIPKFTLTQDLLQNFFGLLDRMSLNDARRKLEIAEQNRLYTERKLQKAYDEFYLSWIFLWRKQEVLQEQLDKSTQSLNNALIQRNSNYIDNGQYQQFYSAHLNYRRSLEVNEAELMRLDQRFARFLGTGFYKPDLAVLNPLLDRAQVGLEPLEFSDSWDWAISEKSLDRVNILYKYSKLQSLPTLTINASLALKTEATYSDSEQPTYSDLVPTYGIGIELSWPAFMRKSRHTVKTLNLQLKQLQTSLSQQQQDFEINIANQRSNQQFLQEQYTLQKEATKARTAIYVSNQIRYRQARASLRDLLDAEIQKLAADLSLLQTENDLVKQLLEYSYETRDQDILDN